MTTFKITLAYDGTEFVGWQRQASGTSIQGLLEEVLREIDQREVAVVGAGRTDAGVHAFGQVASFTLNRSIGADALQRALNGRLRDSVRVVAVDEVAATFHARFGATRKTYRYRIWNAAVLSPFERAYTWHIPVPLDIDAMHAASILIEGRRDFSAFQAAGSATRSSERELFSSVMIGPRWADARQRSPDSLAASGPLHVTAGHLADDAAGGGSASGSELSEAPGRGALVEYEVSGSGFLRHMVRNIVGSLVEIGRGRREVDWITTILEGRDRTQSGPTAPPQGLVLVAVEYGAGRSLAAER